MPKIFLSYHIEGHWPAAGSTDSEPPVPQQPQVPRAAASGPSQQRARGTVPTTSGTHESACKCITSEGHPTSTCLMRKIDNLYKEKLFPRAYLTWEDRKMSCTDYLIANNLKKFKYKIHSKLFFFFTSHPNLFPICLVALLPQKWFLNVNPTYFSTWFKVICNKGYRNNKIIKVKV